MGNKLKNKTSKLLIAVTFLFNLVALPSTEIAEAVALDNAVTVSATNSNGEEVVSMTPVEIEAGDTAYDVLETATDGNLVAPESEFGRFIEEIAGVAPSTEGEYWAFITNGRMADVGADSYTVQNGENIRFSLATWPPTTITATVGATDAQGQAVLPETAVEVVAGSNAYDALHQVTTQAGVPLEVSVDDQWMTAVNNIGSEPLGETEFWQFNVNSEPAPVGVSSYTLTDGDTISFEVVDWAAPEEPVEPTEPEEPAEPVEPTDSTESVNVTTAFENVKNYFGPTVEMTYGDEWKAWALSHDSSNNFEPYIASVAQAVDDNEGQLGGLELQKIVISLSLLNQDATNFNGYDLVENMLASVNSATNTQIYTLLALDSLPEGSVDTATVQNFVDNLLAAEIDGGGWAFFGSTPTVDITAMALAALAPHSDQSAVQAAINRGVETLSDIQGEDGRFYESFSGGNSSEAISQVIVGLTANNIDPLSSNFIKPGGDLINNLLAFQQGDGGFAHLMSDSSSNPMSSEQALLALAAYDLYQNGLGSAYQPTRPIEQPGEEQPGEDQPGEEQPGEEQPSEEQPGEEQPGEEQPGEEQPGEERPITDEKSEEDTEDGAEDNQLLPPTGVAGSLSLVGLTLTGAGVTLVFKNRKDN